MKTRLTLWERLKPEHKQSIANKFSKYPHSHKALIELLSESSFFTTIPYGSAHDIMSACNLEFFGDAFNPNTNE
jgi:hypothetical protein